MQTKRRYGDFMRVQPNKPLRACLLTGALAITALPLVSAADSDRGRDGGDDRRGDDTLLPGNLLVSRTVYSNNPGNVKVGEVLPPDCRDHRRLFCSVRRTLRWDLSDRMEQ
jgi:hypothetical protein